MEFIGTLYRIGELENVSGFVNFIKRPIFVKYVDSKNKEQLVRFILQEPNLELIKNFQLNDRVKINFDFRGFDSVKTGKYFEEKLVVSMSLHEEQNSKKSSKINQPPSNEKNSPDFTRSYDEFPDELLYN